jgi:hypothetical protein
MWRAARASGSSKRMDSGQSGIEDPGYALRIARLRSYYFDVTAEVTPYLLSVPMPERLSVQGLQSGRWQDFRTIAGMVAVVTAMLAGSASVCLPPSSQATR